MAFLPNDRRAQWLDRHAAWLNAETRDYILSLGPYWYADRSLGNKLELYNEDRERLETWSIEAIDVSYEERQMINREKNRQAQGKRRRKQGAKPRGESASRTNGPHNFVGWATLGAGGLETNPHRLRPSCLSGIVVQNIAYRGTNMLWQDAVLFYFLTSIVVTLVVIGVGVTLSGQ